MVDIRPRLSAREVEIIRTALRQYASGRTSEANRLVALRLIERLTDVTVGNPKLRYPELWQ